MLTPEIVEGIVTMTHHCLFFYFSRLGFLLVPLLVAVQLLALNLNIISFNLQSDLGSSIYSFSVATSEGKQLNQLLASTVERVLKDAHLHASMDGHMPRRMSRRYCATGACVAMFSSEDERTKRKHSTSLNQATKPNKEEVGW